MAFQKFSLITLYGLDFLNHLLSFFFSFFLNLNHLPKQIIPSYNIHRPEGPPGTLSTLCLSKQVKGEERLMENSFW